MTATLRRAIADLAKTLRARFTDDDSDESGKLMLGGRYPRTTVPPRGATLSPLQRAAMTGDIEAARRIVARDPNISANAGNRQGKRVRDGGFTPLHIASGRGDLAMVTLLLEHGGRTCDRTERDFLTPLQIALLHEHEEVAMLLVAHGAVISRGDINYDTALHIACRQSSLALCIALVNSMHADDAVPDEYNLVAQTPLTLLAERHSRGEEDKRSILNLIEQLVQRGASPGPGVLEALRHGNVDLARILLGLTAKRGGPTPSLLHIACAAGSVASLEKLTVDDGAVDTADQYGVTPLHVAAHCGWVDIVQWLLARKEPCVDVNAVTSTHDQMTPLDAAEKAARGEGWSSCVTREMESIVRSRHRIDLKYADKMRSGNRAVIDELLRHGAQRGTR